MNNKRTFEIILLVAFGILAVAGLLFFSLQGRRTNQGVVGGNVTIWGTVEEQNFQPLIQNLSQAYPSISVRYLKKEEAAINNDFLEALASGVGPDLIILPDYLVLENRDRLYVTDYQYFPPSDFRANYIDQASLLLTEEGVLGFPLYLDPLLMYYNKNSISSSYRVNAPAYWDEITTLAEELTVFDNQSIIQSGVALGTHRNIPNFKDILSLLILQHGNSITNESAPGIYTSTLNQATQNINLAAKSLEYFTSFSNRENANYSWNSTLKEPRLAFLAEELAIYFDYASFYNEIAVKNPNINYSVSSVPQLRDSQYKASYGKLYGAYISKITPNLSSAYTIATALSSKDYSSFIADAVGTISTHRANLSQKGTTELEEVMRKEAIISRGWLDPNSTETTLIFKDMVNTVLSGAGNTDQAILDAHIMLNGLSE